MKMSLNERTLGRKKENTRSPSMRVEQETAVTQLRYENRQKKRIRSAIRKPTLQSEYYGMPQTRYDTSLRNERFLRRSQAMGRMLSGIRGHPITETTRAAYPIMIYKIQNRFDCRNQMEVFVSIYIPFDLAISNTVVVVLYSVHWSERELSSLTDEDDSVHQVMLQLYTLQLRQQLRSSTPLPLNSIPTTFIIPFLSIPFTKFLITHHVPILHAIT